MLADVYPSAEAAVKDDFFGALKRNVDKLSDDEQKRNAMRFLTNGGHILDGHWDELRNL